MASSKKSPRGNTLYQHVSATLKRYIKPGDRIVAGLSGGIDSVVLLDLLQHASQGLRFKLSALHVNHQINRNADRWATFCRALCKQRGIPCKVIRVSVPRQASLEAAARDARWKAFAALSADYVALAHNLDDQSETLMLQLLRGAGVKGVSAMPIFKLMPATLRPEKKGRSSGHASAVLRPVLDVSRKDIEAHARKQRLQWIEDDSNSDIAFDRNFLRHRVLPVIEQRYPSYRIALARASRHFGEAAQLLDELATCDAGVTTRGLSVAVLRGLAYTRAKNVLRWFLAAQEVTMPNTARLEECARQLLASTPHTSGSIVADLGACELRSYADHLIVVAKVPALPSALCKRWRGERELALPELGGTLILEKCRGIGISLSRMGKRPITIRLREGGERLQPHINRPRRSLKNLLQEADVPPWIRDRLPLMFSGETLIYVPLIGIDAAFHAMDDEPSINPRWEVAVSSGSAA